MTSATGGLTNGGNNKMVGGTGLAPARARAHEFLRLACIHSTTRRKKTGRDGRTRTSAVRGDGAFTARCICCSATSRKKLEARAGFAPARTRRMKPSHCCCATGPKWWSLRVSHPPEFLPARKTTTLRSPRPLMAAAEGLAPSFTGSKPVVLPIRRHRKKWLPGWDSHLHLAA